MTFSVQFPSRLYESREKETLGKEKEEKAGKPEKGPENQRESQRRPAAFPVEDRCRQDRSETIPKRSTYFSEMQSLRFAGCFVASVTLAVCAAPGAESAALQPQPTALDTEWLDLPVVEDIYGDADDKGARKMRCSNRVVFCCFIF